MTGKLLDNWEIRGSARSDLVGVREFRPGRPLPARRDVLDRVGWLMAIHKALRLLYPYNPAIRYSWVCRRNTAFGNLTPLDLMRSEGLIGMYRVSRHLDQRLAS